MKEVFSIGNILINIVTYTGHQRGRISPVQHCDKFVIELTEIDRNDFSHVFLTLTRNLTGFQGFKK